MGDFNKAEKSYIRAHSIRLSLLESTHNDVIAAKHSLAELYQETGRSEDASELFKEIFTLRGITE